MKCAIHFTDGAEVGVHQEAHHGTHKTLDERLTGKRACDLK